MIKTLTENNPYFEWIDVENPDFNELMQVAEQYGLHQSSVQDCLEPDHLPKYEEINGSVFIITRIFDKNAKNNADSIQDLSRKVAVFYSDKFFITIHRSEQPFLRELKLNYVDNERCKDKLQLLVLILDTVIASYQNFGMQISDEIDFYESRIFLRNKLPDLLKILFYIKRKVSSIRRILNLSKEILNKLGNKEIQDTMIRDLQDTFIHIDTIYDQLWEDINNLLSLYLSISAQRTNEVIRVLTIFSVFFLPLTFIVGVYGMNFTYMPELNWEYGYPFAIVLMIAVTFIIFFWFKRKKWL